MDSTQLQDQSDGNVLPFVCNRCDKGHLKVFSTKKADPIQCLSKNLWEIKLFCTALIPCLCNKQNERALETVLQRQNNTPEGALTALIIFDTLYQEGKIKGKFLDFNPAKYFCIDINFNFDANLVLPILKNAYSSMLNADKGGV